MGHTVRNHANGLFYTDLRKFDADVTQGITDSEKHKERVTEGTHCQEPWVRIFFADLSTFDVDVMQGITDSKK